MANKEGKPVDLKTLEPKKKEDSVFQTLKKVNVKGYTEKKGQFDYLSWSKAHTIIKHYFPEAKTIVHEDPTTGLPYFKTTSGKAWVKTTIEIGDTSETERAPVTGHTNQDIATPKETDIRNSIQRCKAKTASLLGLGLELWDSIAFANLPDGEGSSNEDSSEAPKTQTQRKTSSSNFKPVQKTDKELGETVQTMKDGFNDTNGKKFKDIDVRTLASVANWYVNNYFRGKGLDGRDLSDDHKQFAHDVGLYLKSKGVVFTAKPQEKKGKWGFPNG